MDSPEAIQWADSMAPMEEKAQHEPQCPWSRTAWTAPAVTQLTEEGLMVLLKTVVVSGSAPALKPRSLLYSALVQSDILLWPTVKVMAGLELWAWMKVSISLNWAFLNSNSSIVP